MHLSLGGLVKGVTTGLETLVETGNPYIAAGAGAVAFLSSGGSSPASGSTAAPSSYNPLLAELSAENPLEQSSVNALSTFAQQRNDVGSRFADLVAA